VSLEFHESNTIAEEFCSLRENTTTLDSVRRIRGQLEAVERALNQEIDCCGVLQLIAGARGAVNGLMAEVLVEHIRTRVVNPAREPDAQRAHAAEEMIDVVRSYLGSTN
jgi:FrmR/RcnR family transcriptional regulator, repressor of frmRAB operon